MVSVASKARRIITDVAFAVPQLDVSGYSEHEIQLALGEARSAQRCLDGYVARLGSRANQLAKDGKSAPADETFRGRGNVGSSQARRESKRSETTDTIPKLGDALFDGQTSGEHVDAVARHLTRLTDEQRREVDVDALIDKSTTLPPETFNRYMKRLVENILDDHGLADTTAKEAKSEFKHWFDNKSGMGKFFGTLDPERYEAFTNAVDQHTAALAAAADETVSKTSNLAADALVQLVTSTTGRNSRTRLPYVNVLVDHDTIVHGAHEGSIRQTEQGHDIPPETVARLCCDAVLRRVTLDEQGVPINVGRKYRTATDAQWAAIKIQHATCAWEGCTAPINWCQAHHVREWEHGGPTDLDNLVPLCARHHHRVHEGQWRIDLQTSTLPGRALKIYKPDGAHHSTVPPPTRQQNIE